MADRGFGQADVDEMELWVIATILFPPDMGGEPGLLTPEEFDQRSKRDILARLQAAEQAGGGSSIPADMMIFDAGF